MYDFHHTHWVSFYKRSVFSDPIYVVVNCFMFDTLSRLSPDDANLFFSAGHCFVCHNALHCVEQCPVKGHHILFCKWLDDPHHKWWLPVSSHEYWWTVGWDDDCPGLVVTKLREVEWQEKQAHNDAEAAKWAVEAHDGWGNTPLTSPVQERWPGVSADALWPDLSDAVHPDGWPDLSLPSSGVLVTTTMTVEKEKGHSACRLSIL
jgi:hypothetical protein